MPTYKTETMSTGFKLLSDKASEKDVSQFTEFFNGKCAEGWNLLSYTYVTNLFGAKSAIIATFVEGDSAYEYKTVLMNGKSKFLATNANKSDADNFNDEINESSEDGWELVTYSFMSGFTVVSLLTFMSKGTLLATYRRKK